MSHDSKNLSFLIMYATRECFSTREITEDSIISNLCREQNVILASKRPEYVSRVCTRRNVSLRSMPWLIMRVYCRRMSEIFWEYVSDIRCKEARRGEGLKSLRWKIINSTIFPPRYIIIKHQNYYFYFFNHND